MINAFLCGIVNDAGVSFGSIAKPSAWTPVAYTGSRRSVQNALIASASRRDRFHAACALVTLVRHSPLRKHELDLDSRVTYDSDQLAGEIAGAADVITAPTGVAVSYAPSPLAPAEQVWTLRRTGSTSMSVYADGVEEIVSGLAFGASAQVSIVLKSGITVYIVGDPGIGSVITIFRAAPYRFNIRGVASALNALPERDIAAVVPQPYQALLRNAFAFNNAIAICAAAVGVANGE